MTGRHAFADLRAKMSDDARVKSDVLIAARSAGVMPSKVRFSDRLIWKADGDVVTLCSKSVDPNSGLVTVYLNALRARGRDPAQVFNRAVGDPPEDWTPEDEADLPEELQDWSKFKMEDDQLVYQG